MPELLALRDTDPREVGVYRLLGRLGEGGQGVVFLAEGPTGSRAAVKLLPPTTDPQVRSRFLKEVAAAQRVARFCTAQVLDAGIFERRPFIVSEYVSGPSLVEVVEQLGPRGGAALERIAVATLSALGAVHAAGMVHRDFKPGNVLLGPDGPVLIDFGLAAVPGMTTMGPSGQVTIGTPAFMAPEQLAGTRVTAAADMWSWAVTMVFAGTGELPFRGESLTATAYAILHSEPHVGRLPEPLGSLVHRCLSKDPAARPSARGVLGELVAAGVRLMGPMPPMVFALAADEETSSSQRASTGPTGPPQGNGAGLIAAGPAFRPRSARRRSGRTWRRRRAALLLAAILLVAGACALALNLPRHGAESERQAASQVQIAAAIRSQAAAWIKAQVLPGRVILCDTAMCSALTTAGVPAADLETVQPDTQDPLQSAVVVATPAVRNQFGSRLTSVYAPLLLASFGSAANRIDVRYVVPGGTAAFDAKLAPDRAGRIVEGEQLLNNRNIRASGAARAELLAGNVDPRLLITLSALAGEMRLRLVAFDDSSPGAAVPLRGAEIGASAPAGLTAMLAFWAVQRSQYKPSDYQEVKTAGGQSVVTVQYDAPGWLAPHGP
jgi:predicted Ser/Thr protein kinase